MALLATLHWEQAQGREVSRVIVGPHWRASLARIRSVSGDWCERTLTRAVLSLGRSPWGTSGRGRARGVLHVFLLGERIMQRRHPLRPIQPNGYVYYEIAPLPRGCLPLPAQPPVCAGERVIILHFDNPTAVDLASKSGAPSPSWRLLRDARAELATLANLAREGAFPSDIRAVWGESIFTPGVVRLGFTTRQAPPGIRTTFVRLFMLGLIAIYGDSPRDLQERRLRHMRLGEAWMGLDELQRRFGTDERRDDTAPASGSRREGQGA